MKMDDDWGVALFQETFICSMTFLSTLWKSWCDPWIHLSRIVLENYVGSGPESRLREALHAGFSASGGKKEHAVSSPSRSWRSYFC